MARWAMPSQIKPTKQSSECTAWWPRPSRGSSLGIQERIVASSWLEQTRTPRRRTSRPVRPCTRHAPGNYIAGPIVLRIISACPADLTRARHVDGRDPAWTEGEDNTWLDEMTMWAARTKEIHCRRQETPLDSVPGLCRPDHLCSTPAPRPQRCDEGKRAER
ncbi:hypothetical protein CC85DRAFT_138152 [Cutaneotrichosporon oleaginosum]|uniref:Uncharacterized protein n=1 Tax=Cutaneotrichosporon oleaginosum TaxID=879819 RepID=A0A0J0XIL7_9TREE|nr:uncharacterized protein CC85DRAFT_138152 [Cutaneotrichosporon oleaginosum]KLT40918.1 hypothetical protein CC85DRAFT_138152 [Cutaneotrichosporon oleaginosum]TXT15411.1 hypothetical protein COLE_01604 [Cutaneotrichosporon oleaginosum]